MVYEILTPAVAAESAQKEMVAEFLYTHLEQYGDEKQDIAKAIEYAVASSGVNPGGFVISMQENNEIIAAVVVNKTGMEGYIPENILVYIAVHKMHRGKGLGKKLMKEALNRAEGNVALHVEPDNPAKKLYESLGFTNKYLEMRYEK